MTTGLDAHVTTTDRNPEMINRTALRKATFSWWTAGQALLLAFYTAASLSVGAPVFTVASWGAVIVALILFTMLIGYRADLHRQKWAARDLERDLRAERRDREDQVLAESYAQYRHTLTHTPAAQAILDQRDAELQAYAEQERAARRARLAAAGKLAA